MLPTKPQKIKYVYFTKKSIPINFNLASSILQLQQQNQEQLGILLCNKVAVFF